MMYGENLKGLEGKPDLSEVDKVVGSAQPTEWSFKDNDGNKSIHANTM